MMSMSDRKIASSRDDSAVPGSDQGSRSSAPAGPGAAPSSNDGFFSLPALGGSSRHNSLPTAPSISLPKGGGAITGMGEKFDVNQSTGACSMSIPIRVSAARAQMTPQLSLSYSSGSGNGEFGLGWHLEGSMAITRKTSKGIPLYGNGPPGVDGDSDVFLISNAEDLVPEFKKSKTGETVLDLNGKPVVNDFVQDNHQIRRFLPRVMQTFQRIERWTDLADSNNIHWRVLTSENHTIVLGRDSNSRIFDPASNDSATNRIFSWLQCEAWDVYGNAVVYVYKAENSDSIPANTANENNRSSTARTANRYLKYVKYGNATPNRDSKTWIASSALELPDGSWKFSLAFDYGEHDARSPTPTDTESWACRQDPFSHYHAGYEVRTYRLCQRILLFHHFDELGGQPFLVSSTDLTYRHDPAITFLQAVTHSGYMVEEATKSILKRSLPSVDFEYQTFSPDSQSVNIVDESSLKNLPIGLDMTTYRWIDLDGEGLSGVLTEQDGGWYYVRNTTANNYTDLSSENPNQVSARFGNLELLQSMPAMSTEGQAAPHFADIKGAGKLDLVDTAPSAWGYFERDSSGLNGWDNFRTFRNFPAIDANNKDVKFVDLTGDGLADILICDDQVFTWYESLGADGYGPGRKIAQPSNEENGPLCLFSEPEQTLYLADMSGDGLSDIVRIRNSDISYWPNCGYGYFGRLVRMDNAPLMDSCDIYNQSRIRLADIDGSGTTDVIYLSQRGIALYFNQAGNRFSDGKNLESLLPVDDASALHIVDLLGNGTSTIVWSSALPSFARQPLRYIDLNKGVKPHLLSRVVNNLGSETKFHYAPSTKFYLDDLKNGNPWITSLPFPVHCVERVEIFDHISQSQFSQRYSYHHGHYDGVEREFRGFARTDCWDTDSFPVLSNNNSKNIDAAWNLAPVRTTAWFHTGIFSGSESWSHQLAHEYYSSPELQAVDGSSGALLPNSVPPPSKLTGDAMGECYRALKGHVLRKEIYGEDGSDKEKVPYMIQESNFTINIVQDVQDSHQHSVYSVFPREAISCHLERNPKDARIEHSLVLEQDSFGNAQRAIKVVYGRREGNSTLSGADKAKQETSMLLYMETELTKTLNTNYDYRVPTACETRAYQVTGFRPHSATARFSFIDFTGEKLDFSPLDSLPEIPFETGNDDKAVQKRNIQRSRIHFRKNDLTGLLPLGQVESMALPGQDYTKCFTPGLISGIYKRQGTALIPDTPGFLTDGIRGTPLGYVDLDNDGSWWKMSGHVFYTATPKPISQVELADARANFFQPFSFVDIFSNTTVVAYDPYTLIPVKLVDSVKNVTSALVDYRVMKHRLVTDANGNQVEAAFDVLGMVSGVAELGKPGSNADSVVGFKAELTADDLNTIVAQPKSAAAFSLLGNATRRTFYDYTRFSRSKQPCFSGSILRVWRTNPAQPSLPDARIDFSYSDGSGRVVQSKQQAKPGPLVDGGSSIRARWIGTGWTVFNNKGNAVRQYQPYFDDTHDFKFDLRVGPSVIKIYDALSRVVASLQPDHTVAKHSFDCWSTAAYDPNDNVKLDDPRKDPDIGHLIHDLPEHEFLPSWFYQRINGQKGASAKEAAQKTLLHADTPHITHFDALGRAIIEIKDKGSGQLIYQRVDYDVSGHIRKHYDANGTLVELTDVSMDGVTIHRASMEGGEHWTLQDAQGKEVLNWNLRGFRTREVCDAVRRPLESWVIDVDGVEKLVRQNLYGETALDAAVHNLKGQLYRISDQSGQLTHTEFDYLGNLLASTRTLAQNYVDTLDWSGHVELEGEKFSVGATFDALSRPVLTTSPDGTETHRIYNDTGHIESIFLNVRGDIPSDDPTTWTSMLKGVEHGANSEVLSTDYGNGVTCKRSYDSFMYRLINIQSRRKNATSEPNLLQDLNYTFDAVGNLTHVHDQAQQDIFFRNNRIDPSMDYTFDATYQLITATGREHLGQTNGQSQGATPPGPFSASISDSPADGNAMGEYTETYEYDKAGNILSMAHALSDATYPGWKRLYVYNEPSQLLSGELSNRLTSTKIGTVSESYTYDVHGNMKTMPHLRLMNWNYADLLRATSKQIFNNGTPEITYYVYDDQGNRIRKVTESSGGGSGAATPSRIKDRIYIDGWEVFRTFNQINTVPKSERVSVSIDDEGMIICRIDSQTIQDPSGELPARVLRFELRDQINSVSLILDDQARLVSYEEYFPHGGTAFESTDNQNDVPKRYRYCGKEKDDETGLYAYGHRYFAPWLGRWTSADPGGTVDGFNLYQFVHNNPIVLHDPDGGMAAAVLALGPIIAGEATVSAAGGPPGWLVGAVVITGTVLVGVAIYAFTREPPPGPVIHPPTVAPPPAVPAPIPTAVPVPAPIPAPVPTTVPVPVPIPVPAPIPIPVPRRLPRTIPTTQPRVHPRAIPQEKVKPDIDIIRGGWQQHHIFSKQYKWFFDALGINVDKADNTIMLRQDFHSLIHKMWNPMWKKIILDYVDWKTLEASGGRVLKFQDPYHLDKHGNPTPISNSKMAGMVYGLGKTLQLAMIASGEGMPALKDYGDYPNKELFERRPKLKAVLTKNIGAKRAMSLGLLGPRLKGGRLVN